MLRNCMHSYKEKKIKVVSHTLSTTQKHIDMLFLQGNGWSFLDNVEPLILPTSVFHFPRPKGTSSQIRGSLPQVPTMVPWRNHAPSPYGHTAHILSQAQAQNNTEFRNRIYITVLSQEARKVRDSGNILPVKTLPLSKAHLGVPTR